jgi:hypothetical protein
MPLLGKAALAMWWDMAAAHRTEFEDWHSHEHFPERLRIPGFQRGSRWTSATGGEGFFVLYELQVYETLTSPAYFARLNAPTPWSTLMMPRHLNMVRSQCHVLDSHGGGIGGVLLTVRLSPAAGREEGLRAQLQQLLGTLPQRPGVTAAHLLRTQTPQAAATTEQRIRGGADGVADWIMLVAGYDVAALQELAEAELGPSALSEAGAMPAQVSAVYRLSLAMTPQDF